MAVSRSIVAGIDVGGNNRWTLLARAGVTTESLKNIDEVDAALCALAAHYFLTGAVRSYGNESEGFIIVPNQPLSMPA